MASVYQVLYSWAVRTTTSFAELLAAGPAREGPPSLPPEGGMIYRLKTWPTLPHGMKTAKVYRVLSVMSQRPVNRRWMGDHCGLKSEELDSLIDFLAEQEALEVIDASRFTGK